jgi:hypothetical protein
MSFPTHQPAGYHKIQVFLNAKGQVVPDGDPSALDMIESEYEGDVLLRETFYTNRFEKKETSGLKAGLNDAGLLPVKAALYETIIMPLPQRTNQTNPNGLITQRRRFSMLVLLVRAGHEKCHTPCDAEISLR